MSRSACKADTLSERGFTSQSSHICALPAEILREILADSSLGPADWCNTRTVSRQLQGVTNTVSSDYLYIKHTPQGRTYRSYSGPPPSRPIKRLTIQTTLFRDGLCRCCLLPPYLPGDDTSVADQPLSCNALGGEIAGRIVQECNILYEGCITHLRTAPPHPWAWCKLSSVVNTQGAMLQHLIDPEYGQAHWLLTVPPEATPGSMSSVLETALSVAHPFRSSENEEDQEDEERENIGTRTRHVIGGYANANIQLEKLIKTMTRLGPHELHWLNDPDDIRLGGMSYVKQVNALCELAFVFRRDTDDISQHLGSPPSMRVNNSLISFLDTNSDAPIRQHIMRRLPYMS